MTDTQASVEAIAALEAWQSDAFRELTLTGGRKVRVAPGSTAILLTTGLLPQPLVDAVLGSDDQAPAEALKDPRMGFELVTKAQEIAAAAIREVWHDEAWVTVSVDVPTFGRLPDADRREISKVALGEELGELAYDALATFRDKPAGAPPGDGGGTVPPGPVGAPNRAARRARPRGGAAPSARKARAR